MGPGKNTQDIPDSRVGHTGCIAEVVGRLEELELEPEKMVVSWCSAWNSMLKIKKFSKLRDLQDCSRGTDCSKESKKNLSSLDRKDNSKGVEK